eukprot:1518499-Amphidinium_carterae.1
MRATVCHALPRAIHLMIELQLEQHAIEYKSYETQWAGFRAVPVKDHGAREQLAALAHASVRRCQLRQTCT